MISRYSLLIKKKNPTHQKWISIKGIMYLISDILRDIFIPPPEGRLKDFISIIPLGPGFDCSALLKWAG